jgi:hypothetical protein
MARYAEGTTTTVPQSQAEIGRTLERYGAKSVAYAYEPGRAMVVFVAHDRQVRFVLDLPTDRAKFKTPRRRAPADLQKALDGEVRRLWRSLAMAIKAKLEIVASDISTFEREFLAQIVLPDGTTVAEHALPAVAEAYRTGMVPALLPDTRRAIGGTG